MLLISINRPVDKGGRPPFDPVFMFKILVIQRLNNFGDDNTEFLLNDRRSFERFLGLDCAGRVPDAKTIWLFRDQLDRKSTRLNSSH